MTDPLGGFGGFDPRIFSDVPLFRELYKVMQWSGGPVNWDLAAQTAVAIARSHPDGEPAEQDEDAFADAVGVAEMWLDAVTDLPAVDGPARALSREEWTRLATSSAGLGVYVEPMAAGMAAALGKGLPEEMAGMGPMMSQQLGAIGALLYGMQVGTVAGHLAGQLLGTYDLGVPTVDPSTIGPVGRGAASFAADYGFDHTELRFWLALHEAAHRRQFAGVAWLRPHIGELIRGFAAEADFDPDRMMEQFGAAGLGAGFDPTDPEALQRAMSEPDAFRLEPTTGQLAVLSRLQSLVALTHGWADIVVAKAAADRLPGLARIDEAMRRRRAEKGKGEEVLEQLIGLDLKPSDLRQGRAFCEAVIAARGQEGLDRIWAGPELLPSPEELAEPSRWLIRMAARELDAELGDDTSGS